MNQPFYPYPGPDQAQQAFAAPTISLYVVVEYDMSDVPTSVHPMPSEVEGHLKVEELMAAGDVPRRVILSGPWFPGEGLPLAADSADRVMRVERNNRFIF